MQLKQQERNHNAQQQQRQRQLRTRLAFGNGILVNSVKQKMQIAAFNTEMIYKCNSNSDDTTSTKLLMQQQQQQKCNMLSAVIIVDSTNNNNVHAADNGTGGDESGCCCYTVGNINSNSTNNFSNLHSQRHHHHYHRQRKHYPRQNWSQHHHYHYHHQQQQKQQERAAETQKRHRRYCGKFCNISSSFYKILTTTLLLFFITLCDFTDGALRNVNLFIEPPAVRRGQSVTLRCHYNLEGAPLYSVKFYRGQLEFFRYTPGEYPNTKVFPYPGFKVDENVSNATQVVIRNVSFGLSGNFSCEVTADAPLFSTATAYAQMQVVEFPEKRPQLFTELTRYEPGDILRANCSTPPSRPRAELRFTLNNIPVSTGETQYIRTVDNLIASRLSLKLQLQAAHFATGSSNVHMMNGAASGGANDGIGMPYTVLNPHGSGATSTGGLILRCTAQIGDLYQEYKEIELGTPQKDPVPARVTLSSGSGLRNFFETYFAATSSAAATTASRPTIISRTTLSALISNRGGGGGDVGQIHALLINMAATAVAAAGVAFVFQLSFVNICR